MIILIYLIFHQTFFISPQNQVNSKKSEINIQDTIYRDHTFYIGILKYKKNKFKKIQYNFFKFVILSVLV